MGHKSSSPKPTTQSVLEYAERGTLCLGIFTGGLAIFQGLFLQVAVPTLSLSLVLGYFNRRQMDQTLLEHVVTLKSDFQKLEKATSRPIPQPRLNLGVIEQQISDLHSQDGALHQAIADLNQQLQGIPTQSTLDELDQSLAQLTQIVKHLQHDGLTRTEPDQAATVDTNVEVELAKVQAAHQALGAQLQMQLDEMHHEISVLRTQPIPASLIDLAGISRAPVSDAPLETAPEPVESPTPVEPTPSSQTLDLLPLTTELQWVSGQVNSLQLQLQQLIQQSQQTEIAMSTWEQLAEDVQNLTHRVDAWEKNSDQRWSSVKQGLSTMPQIIQSQLNEQLQAYSQDTVKPEEFYVLQRHVQQQTDALRAKVEQAVARFSQDIDTLSSQIQGLAHAPMNGKSVESEQTQTPPNWAQSTPLSLRPLIQPSLSTAKPSPAANRSPVPSTAQRQPKEESPDWDSLLAELDESSL